MKIGLVGVGHIGKKYASLILSSKNQLIMFDPRFSRRENERYLSVSDISLELGESVDVWVVASSTKNHLCNIKEILKINPAAKILVEKPACLPNELKELDNTLSQYKKASIVVSDIYKHSSSVQSLTRVVKKTEVKSKIKKISIEFSKNRLKDEVEGRFQDEHYGIAGYECFHIFSILKSLLSKKDFDSYIHLHDENYFDKDKNFLNENKTASGIAVLIASSIRGEIILNSQIGRLYNNQDVQKMINRKEIDFGSEFRYRFAEVQFCNGDVVTLVFEPDFGNDNIDSKNNHAVAVYVEKVLSFEKVSSNQLEESFFKQIKGLHDSTMVKRNLSMEIHKKLVNISQQKKNFKFKNTRPSYFIGKRFNYAY